MMKQLARLVLFGLLLYPSLAFGAGTLINGDRVIEGTVNYCLDTGSANAYACNLSPAITAYTTGGTYMFKATNANTTTSTLALNSLSAITIKKAAGGITTNLAANDILSGQFVIVTYDGTNFQMQSTLGNAPSGSGTVTSIATTSPITGGTITATGTIACATCVTSSASLADTKVVVGSGGAQGVAASALTATVTKMTSGVPSAATVGTDYGTPDATTKTLTNTTIDAEGTGNVITIPVFKNFSFAGCNNTTAGTVWDLPTSNAGVPACGADFYSSWTAFADGQFASTAFRLPDDWSGAVDVRLTFAGGGSDTSGTVIPSIATACTATGGTVTDAPTFNTADNLSTITLATAANRVWTSSKTGITMTGCAAGNLLHLKMGRATDTASSAARYLELEVKMRRAM